MNTIKKKLAQRFRNLRINHKIMVIYFLLGTIPLVFLVVFLYSQQRMNLVETQKRVMGDTLNQGVEHLNSQILAYNNLMDYVAFNQPISKVLSAEYENVYQRYEQYSTSVDPVLSSLKFFNSNILQITIYIDQDIVPHDSTIAPLTEIKEQSWYQDFQKKKSKEVVWVIDQEKRDAFAIRKMPMLEEKNVEAVLCLKVEYNQLFQQFSTLYRENYGLYITDDTGNVLYSTKTLSEKNEKKELSWKALSNLMEKNRHSEESRVWQGKVRHYLFAQAPINASEWNISVYEPMKLLPGGLQLLIAFILGILIICILSSLVASRAFSRLVVHDITSLRDNMKEVENGNMQLQVSSDSKDEIGELIRGFGSMLERINYLITEVYEGKLRLRKTEMKALQAQINPHFLYNSLSLINWKALEADQEDISKITLALSSFYRTSLNRGRNVLTIERELENMKSYLEIQSCMHDDNFDVIMDIDKRIFPYQTLNLLLQPLVENAIEHGIDLKEDGKGFIKIVGRMDEYSIFLIVEDNGVGMEPDILNNILEYKTKSYGVRNVNERIKLYYGEEYCLHIESEKGKGTKCTIRIPKVTEE